MDNATKDVQSRKKRIARIKKVIVIFAFTLIIIPIVMCFLLFIKVSKLENKIDDLMSYTQSASIGEQKAGVTGLITNGEEKVTSIKITDDPLNNEILDTQELSTDASIVSTNEKETEILTAAAKNEKPDANDKIIEGMVKGRINKELKEICLLDQVYVKAEDGKQSVAAYVKEVAKANSAIITIKKFVRFETGEGIAKKEENFAEEVAKQVSK